MWIKNFLLEYKSVNETEFVCGRPKNDVNDLLQRLEPQKFAYGNDKPTLRYYGR